MKPNNSLSQVMYGISRIDDLVHRTHAWRVSLSRQGKRLVKNFPDKKHGGKAKALKLAKSHRDELLVKYPPMSRKEFVTKKRRNNKSGITGVYTYAKRFQLRDGSSNETWYWEANWPTERGESMHASFSVRQYGEAVARQMAIRAREQGLRALKGVFWASERGEVDNSNVTVATSASNTVTDEREQFRVA